MILSRPTAQPSYLNLRPNRLRSARGCLLDGSSPVRQPVFAQGSCRDSAPNTERPMVARECNMLSAAAVATRPFFALAVMALREFANLIWHAVHRRKAPPGHCRTSVRLSNDLARASP